MRIFAMISAAILAATQVQAATFTYDFTVTGLTKAFGAGPEAIDSLVYQLVYDDVSPDYLSVAYLKTEPFFDPLRKTYAQNNGTKVDDDGKPDAWDLSIIMAWSGGAAAKGTFGTAWFKDGQAANVSYYSLLNNGVTLIASYTADSWSWEMTGMNALAPVPLPASALLLAGALAGAAGIRRAGSRPRT